MSDIVALILAGGSGTRLWPCSRQRLPKQYLRLAGERTLLDGTIDRLAPFVARSDVWVATSEAHAGGEAFTALAGLHLMLEPVGRNTAPAIALAAAWVRRTVGGDPVLLVLPADHLIRDVPAFHRQLGLAVAAAENGALVTFGITPEYPETGFGYIQAGESVDGVASVRRFVEKPDLATAESFLAAGDYFWNSGMFVWKASTILAEVATHLPQVAAVLASIEASWDQGIAMQAAVHTHFAAMPNISIDYGVMERSDRVRLVPASIGWSDVGSWDAVYDFSDKDAAGNACSGDVLMLDSRNSLLRAESRLIAAVGVEDLIAVETADAILLCKRGESQQVKSLVDQLSERHGRQHIEHLTVRRPWGSYTVLEDRGNGYKLKRIEVMPGESLSLQAHQHRSEHWVVVSGTATITRGDEVLTVAKNESTYIPIGVRHRLANRGKIALVIVEVQVGDYLGEDDIERFDDRYGRPSE